MIATDSKPLQNEVWKVNIYCFQTAKLNWAYGNFRFSGKVKAQLVLRAYKQYLGGMHYW